MGVKVGLSYAAKALEEARLLLSAWENYNTKHDLYMHGMTIDWNYEQKRPYKGDVLKEKRRLYLLLYHCREKAATDELAFNRMLKALQSELESGKRVASHDKKYEQFFEIKATPKRGLKAMPKQEAIDAAKRNFGHFALISNIVKDPARALEIYRNKDVVEKAFGNLKERLDCRRFEVSSELSLEGKLFAEFIALIYLSYIKKRMHDADLQKKYTLRGLLDRLDVIECFEITGKKLRIGEVTEKQKELYCAMGVPSISSLC
jgi:transposase